MTTPVTTAALTASYLTGSIPTAYLLVRQAKGIDVRTVGSGNVGATNASRVLGFKGGAAVFVLDLLKGVVASRVIAPWLIPWAGGTGELACGFAAILGHNFSAFLKFRGGKGVATTIGVLAGTMPLVAAVCGAIGLGAYAVTKYVSVGSLTAAVALPIVQALAGQPPRHIALGAVLMALIVIRHRENIRRLIDGTELRAGRRQSEKVRRSS